jgi:hypothetical protein
VARRQGLHKGELRTGNRPTDFKNLGTFSLKASVFLLKAERFWTFDERQAKRANAEG